MVLTIKSKKGAEYFRSEFNGSWWRRGKMDRANYFIGAEKNLPKEILKILKDPNYFVT
jgi:hypothetical protein